MRARNIKPGFFENEEIGELDYMTRLLFVGLWCYADRDGYFEARLKKIKAMIFPYDNIATEVIQKKLASLEASACLLVYTPGPNTIDSNGKRYQSPIIFIPGFCRHQSPHTNEKPSFIKPIIKTCILGDKHLSPRIQPLRPDCLIDDCLIDDCGMRKAQSFVQTPENPEFGQLANLLFQKIVDRNPNHKVPDFKKWRNHIRLMITIDKRDPSKIEQIINWCQADAFWQNNILSPEKLRKQYDQLILKMNSNGSQYKTATERRYDENMAVGKRMIEKEEREEESIEQSENKQNADDVVGCLSGEKN